MSFWRSAAALGLAFCLASANAGATSASLFGIGPRSRALAGAGLSQDLGYEAAFANPAALSLATTTSLSAGYDVTSSWLYLQREGSPEQRFEADPLTGAELGFTLPFELCSQRLVLGFASLSPGGSVARAELPLAEVPQFPVLLSRQRAVDFDLALGVRPFQFLALGLGVRALSSLTGTAQVERRKTTTTTRVSDSLEPVLAPVVGVSAFFGPATTLALALRTPLRADFDIQLDAVDLGATQLPPLNLAGVAHYDPLTVQAELSRRAGRLEGMVGAAYQRFRDTPTLLPRTVSCPVDRPDCLALAAEPPHFHDTVDLHVALTLALPLTADATGKLRAGYAFAPSPVPAQTGPSNLLDNARHRLALGYGLALTKPLPPIDVDCALSLDELVRRTSRKQPGIATDNAGAPALSTRGRIVGFSLGLTVKL
ncbi:MAG TPA: hypothetical protein VNG33_23635 [Polyangiaceae bacterium]|nr:hypothetical protein [Polyangiaceae bacterium]